MAFSKSKFLTLFLLFCSLHLGFANEEVVDDPNAQSEIMGQLLPYAQDCCIYGHTGNCAGSPNCCGGGGEYCNPPPCVQNGNPCGQNGCGCVQNPSNRCCVGSGCQPSPPCQWQGPCPSCGCVRNNVKVEAQHESDHPSSEPISAKNEGN